MGFINGLRSFGYQSSQAAMRSKSKKRESTEQWEDALAKAEDAHTLLRDAAVLSSKGKFDEAEEMGTEGIDMLKKRLVVQDTLSFKLTPAY